jgi:DNA-binding transcriptional LysR family regulator
LSDLLRREADIAIRHVRPEQADLIAQKVRDSSAYLYAARSYLKRHGGPKQRDLTDHVFVGADDNPRFVEVLGELGARVHLDQFKWTTDSHLVGWEMVRRGLGIGGMLEEIAESTPGIERVLPKLPPIPVPYWLCTHRELATSRRIRVTFDLLLEALSGPLSAAGAGAAGAAARGRAEGARPSSAAGAAPGSPRPAARSSRGRRR